MLRSRAPFVLAAILLLPFCSREQKRDVSQNAPSHETQTTVNPQSGTNAENSTAMNPVVPVEKGGMASKRVPGAAVAAPDVQLEEYEIRMADVLPAGAQSLHLSNAGKEQHGFVIEGNGVHRESPTLQRGDRSELSLDLKPGTYEVYCPVDGHRGKGMHRTITVH